MEQAPRPESNAPIKTTDSIISKPKPHRRWRIWIIVGIIIIAIIALALISIRSYFANSESEIPIFPTPTQTEISATVTATSKPTSKKKTVPKTTSTPTSNPVPADQTARIVNYFVDTTNYLQGRTQPVGITRWNKATINLKIIEGTPTATEQSALTSFISDFNSQSTSTKLQITSGSSVDIRVFFEPRDVVNQLRGINSDIDGFAEWSTNDDCSLLESRVFISNDPSNAADFQIYLVRHELTHALGFWGHSDVYPGGIMAVASANYNFPDIDKKAIKMLYNSGLPLCTQDAGTRQFFQSHPIP